eukprot:TRINITY_DN15676_c0_g1_i1.p2 TRINITY_DN15676_c0_g1~~TRINITY_DN15676_c0_g1_i1.p2  ORF type:complete len:327 (-),score=67.11 TRINITY_DN15676_c0_g1_i1:93-1073(-)
MLEELVNSAVTESTKRILLDRFTRLDNEIDKHETETLALIQETKEKFQIDREQFFYLRKRVDDLIKTKDDDVVSLNVGGTIFTTKRSSFLIPGSLFCGLLSTWVKNPRNEYFIDRDPTVFPYIMSFLRTGEWRIHNISSEELERLEMEMDFYGLEMERECFKLDEFKCNCHSITNNFTTCTGSGTVLGVHPLPSYAVWEVEFESKTGNSWSAFGIVSGRADRSNLCTDTMGCGIYIDQVNCHFRQRSNNEENLQTTIGPALPGKVIRVIYRRDETTTIQFETDGRRTPKFTVRLPDKMVYVALSPSTDSVMTLRQVNIPIVDDETK